jgi:hypothetical protein
MGTSYTIPENEAVLSIEAVAYLYASQQVLYLQYSVT